MPILGRNGTSAHVALSVQHTEHLLTITIVPRVAPLPSGELNEVVVDGRGGGGGGGGGGGRFRRYIPSIQWGSVIIKLLGTHPTSDRH